MNDKDLWQEPKKGQPYGINYWITPAQDIPDFNPESERLAAEIKTRREESWKRNFGPESETAKKLERAIWDKQKK